MAIEPSPTAEATRLTERCLTSPAANTPGMLVSTSKGGRSRGHPWGNCPLRKRSWPVRMKPPSSRWISSGSQLVRGLAPMRTNRLVAGTIDGIEYRLKLRALVALARRHYDRERSPLPVTGKVYLARRSSPTASDRFVRRMKDPLLHLDGSVCDARRRRAGGRGRWCCPRSPPTPPRPPIGFGLRVDQ
jgi:hypothetical protein